MKNNNVGFGMAVFIIMTALIVVLALTGCYSTITRYDKDGNITSIENTTNASRFYDGTNDKSQIMLVDAIYLKSDISVTAGESYTPGWTLTFVNGKSALMNIKNGVNFEKADAVVNNFFKDIKVSKDGVETSK